MLLEFAINGAGIPNVDFDVGESYAGLLPISETNSTAGTNGTADELYFWFFPSTNPAAKKEILLWVTGGVGYLARLPGIY